MKTSQVCAMPLKCFEAQERHEQTKDCTYNEESVSQAENKKIYKKYQGQKRLKTSQLYLHNSSWDY